MFVTDFKIYSIIDVVTDLGSFHTLLKRNLGITKVAFSKVATATALHTCRDKVELLLFRLSRKVANQFPAKG